MHDPRAEIKELILREFLPGEKAESLTTSEHLISGGVLDSLDVVRLVVLLEEHFGIELKANEATQDYLDTVDMIGDLVASRLTSR